MIQTKCGATIGIAANIAANTEKFLIDYAKKIKIFAIPYDKINWLIKINQLDGTKIICKPNIVCTK